MQQINVFGVNWLRQMFSRLRERAEQQRDAAEMPAFCALPKNRVDGMKRKGMAVH